MRNALIVAAVLVAGCAEPRMTSPPGEPLDLGITDRATMSVNALMTGAGMSGVAALSGRMPAELSLSSPVIASSRPAVIGVPALALRLLESLPAAGGPLAVQVIRPAVLGHTYVYDPAVRRYVRDPAGAGAPVNGVRFILYAVDPASREPRADQEIGFADLTDDNPTGFVVGLRFRGVVSGRTFLDYAFTLTPALSGGSLRVSGFLAGEAHRLDFTLGATGQTVGRLQAAHVTFDLAVPTEGFHATGTIDAAAGGGEGAAQVDVIVTIGSNALHLTAASNGASVNAAVSVNGRLFATITGDPRHPSIRGEGGRELTEAERRVLGGLVGMVFGVIEMFEHLLEPIGGLLGLSVSL